MKLRCSKSAKWFCAFILVLIMLLGASGCEKKSTTTKEPVEPVKSVDQEYVNPAMFNSNIVRVGLPELNRVPTPYDARGVTEQSLIGLVYEGLLRINENGNIESDLAQTYSISEDHKQIAIDLKRGVLFHNGTVLKSEHVYNVYLFLDEFYAEEEFFKRLKSVEVVDDYHLIFHISDFVYEDLNALTMPIYLFGLGNSDESSNATPLKSGSNMPLGTGPFALNSHEQNVWTLTRNTHYRNSLPSFDTIKIITLSDSDRVLGLKTGTLDLAYVNPTIDNEKQIIEIPYLDTVEVTSDFLVTLGLDLSQPLFSDVKFRQALQYGINRELFVNEMWPIGGEVAYAPVPNRNPNFPKEQALNNYKYDPIKAGALLDDMGITLDDETHKRIYNEDPVVLNLTAFSEVTWAHKLALRVKEDLAILGIDVIVQKKDFKTLSEGVFQDKNIKFYTMGWTLPLFTDQESLYGSNGELNALNYSNSQADLIFRALDGELNQSSRQGHMIEWLQIANDELPHIYIAYKGELWGVNERLKGFKCDSYSPWTEFILNWELIKP